MTREDNGGGGSARGLPGWGANRRGGQMRHVISARSSWERKTIKEVDLLWGVVARVGRLAAVCHELREASGRQWTVAYQAGGVSKMERGATPAPPPRRRH